MKARIAGLAITIVSVFCFMFAAETLCAQDANYVVTKKAPEIEIYNHDGQVIGTLKRGDRVFVTMFHQALPQADGSCSEPVTFIEYEGEEGYLLLGSPDWLCSLENEVVAAPSAISGQIPVSGKMMRILALGTLALLLVLARPVSVIEWRIRGYIKGKGVAILTGVLLLVWCIISLYIVYLLYESGWFNTWRRSGFFRMVGNIFWMLLWFITQFAVLNVTVMGLAGMKQRIYIAGHIRGDMGHADFRQLGCELGKICADCSGCNPLSLCLFLSQTCLPGARFHFRNPDIAGYPYRRSSALFCGAGGVERNNGDTDSDLDSKVHIRRYGIFPFHRVRPFGTGLHRLL